MALRRLPFKTPSALIGRHLGAAEDPETVALMRALRPARGRGYLRRSELERICYWKSPRAISYIRSNSAAAVRAATAKAFSTRSERHRLAGLTELRGVSVPMASSILMLMYPKRYGVIDIRVWQLLHKFGAVTRNSRGTGFSFKNWYRFLMLIRYYARRFRCGARDVERALFRAHKKYQRGRLYGR